jgi:acyl-CoA reductase-like NAD-dependent aldehyde dehydrogenase
MSQQLANFTHGERVYVGGEWLLPEEGKRIEIISPSTEKLLGAVGDAGSAEVDKAVAAARHAFDNGPWPQMSGKERAVIMRKLAAKVAERAGDFAEAWTTQVGMPLRFSQFAAQSYPGYIEYFADLAERIGFEEIRKPAADGVCMVVREPVGVVVAIVPWNAPMPTLLLKIAPALAAGCTVIAKPSPETPLEALLLAECIDEIGIPEGVFSVLPAGREVSDYLIRKPEVDKVSFTGSTAVGLHIASVCGARMARVVTELGGKSAAIILEDADINTVVGGIMPNLVGLTGQQCAAFSRILVPASRKAEVEGALSAAMSYVVTGDPYDDMTTMGPLIAKRQLDRVCGLVAKGTEQGAKLITGGKRPANLERGWFIEPTLFTDVDNSMTIAREEIFGPVGSIITYMDLEDAIRIANDSLYGLSGGVFTADTDHAYAVARRIRTGNFAQNGRVIDFTMPYGGFKLSGIGREGGIEGLHSFTEVKAVFLPKPPAGFSLPA